MIAGEIAIFRECRKINMIKSHHPGYLLRTERRRCVSDTRYSITEGKKCSTGVIENKKGKRGGKSATRIIRLQSIPLASTDLISGIKSIKGRQTTHVRENARTWARTLTKLLFLESACRFNPTTSERVCADIRVCVRLSLRN